MKLATFLLCLPWSKQNNSKLPLKYTRLQTGLLQSPWKNRGWWQRLHFLPCLHTHWISFVLLWRRKILASWLPTHWIKSQSKGFLQSPQNGLCKFTGTYWNWLHCPSRGKQPDQHTSRETRGACWWVWCHTCLKSNGKEEAITRLLKLACSTRSSPFSEAGGRAPFGYLKHENFLYLSPGDQKP